MTVLEPAQVARVALDEIVRIFAAERAFLFLGKDDVLLPYQADTAAGVLAVIEHASRRIRVLGATAHPTRMTPSCCGVNGTATTFFECEGPVLVS